MVVGWILLHPEITHGERSQAGDDGLIAPYLVPVH